MATKKDLETVADAVEAAAETVVEEVKKAAKKAAPKAADAAETVEKAVKKTAKAAAETAEKAAEAVSEAAAETVAKAAGAVKEAAAIGVPSEFSEDDVMVIVAPAEGASIDPAALIEFLRPRMSHFMIPRYVRVLAELPKTPSNKVMKHQLRQEGITADTWDREKAGIKVKSDRFGATEAAE